ncbi:MAG: Trp family transcriptional regulator [Cellvibrionales bacterium]|nr:Trp family transcriptional regulator [Cellvibrionales bacterium]
MSTPKQLIDFLHKAKSKEELISQLEFLLTPTEMQEFNNRILIAKRLEAGEPQRLIAKELGVAIATVSRGARALKAFKSSDLDLP